ncbi:MAG TPA: MBL fold metallo-hydrolase [Propionicimonas sp.]|nr:MBL fold metallo-hydrolase [Propionicimonas sp.]HRA05368.1 MBL fold metallo-hydrolase [Propionicimonas sp.]
MVQFNLGEFEPVADQVLVAVAEPAGVNIGLVIGPKGCLVIDTGSSPAQGASIRRAAERAAGVPVAAVLVTHWHYDHLFGLAAFTDVPSYAHDTVPGWLSSPQCREAAHGLGVEVPDLVAPNRTFSLARVIDLGGRRVETVHFGRGHTDGDVVAIVPDAGVIFSGDLLESAGPPDFGDDCHLKEWPSAVDGILGLVAENTIIVPGHGAPMDRLAAFTQRAEISALWGQVEHLIARGVRLSDAYSEGEWPFDEHTVVGVLPMLYGQFAAAGITPRTQLPLA